MSELETFFDIVVLGGGHAGVEAAHIASQFQLKVALVTLPGVPLASAPCNPAVGGVGKGQVVREIDALGGVMGIFTDKAGIQYRTLNASKGDAVRSTRVQIDKYLYSREAEKYLSQQKNLVIKRFRVNRVLRDSGRFFVELDSGEVLWANKVVVTAGTFLGGKLHFGSDQRSGGRIDSRASLGGATIFPQITFLNKRFKTGTPPRLLNNSIDFSKMEAQPSDSETLNFHWNHSHNERFCEQQHCYITYTNIETMSVIRENRESSPLFNGQIQGVGPRYCPSIEDKAFRYPDRNSHHLFIEPESAAHETWYPNGVSTSLPVEIQKEFLRTIVGLENAEIAIPGYAVEYDVVDTSCLYLTLESKEQEGIYFAGQVNGTSGYEEAAGQGIVAGINAALSALGKPPMILGRYHSYIGVMIEDLVFGQRDEPYRLFTARAENRLYIREDNVFIRMYVYRKQLGLNTSLDFYYQRFFSEYTLLESLSEQRILTENMTLADKLRQNDTKVVEVLQQELESAGIEFSYLVVRCLAISKKYEGFIKKALDYYAKLETLDSMKISWKEIGESKNISLECRQRITKTRPINFGQLKLIEGIRPATLSIVASKLY